MIDAHHHIWRLDRLPWLAGDPVPRIFGPHERLRRDYPIEEYAADAHAAGVIGSVYVQANVAPGAEKPSSADASPDLDRERRLERLGRRKRSALARAQQLVTRGHADVHPVRGALGRRPRGGREREVGAGVEA